MNNINSKKLKEGLNGIKALTISGIIFLLLTVGLGTWIYLVKTGNYQSVAMKTTNNENTYVQMGSAILYSG